MASAKCGMFRIHIRCDRRPHSYVYRAIIDRIDIYFIAITDRNHMSLQVLFAAIDDRNHMRFTTTMACIPLQPRRSLTAAIQDYTSTAIYDRSNLRAHHDGNTMAIDDRTN